MTLMTRKEAAARLGMSLPTLDQERSTGRLAYIQRKPGSKVWITDEAIADTAMPMPSKPGYTLKGWYADAQLTGDAVEELPGAFPPGT